METTKDDRAFMDHAFLKLQQRGWLAELIPSSITDTDIAAFEQGYQIKLPTIFKQYLTAYKLPEDNSLVGLVRDCAGNVKIETLDWHDLTDDISDLSEDLECFRNEFEEWDTPPGIEKYRNLFYRLWYERTFRCY